MNIKIYDTKISVILVRQVLEVIHKNVLPILEKFQISDFVFYINKLKK